ncbi:phage tail protein [Chromobacterium subtsugae]|uniref:phage tail protein n=2 Tax=Chromobacterium subtsugae TaxID=251747 RepID=UPI0006993C45|nr:phage tail protein [Chromobacterium subtsugae]
MADLKEPAEPKFPPVYQLELTDRVRAGAGGISNRQAEQLVERTGFLKKKVDDLVSGALTAKSAEHLAAPRNLAMTGDGAWSVTFDGSGNASGALTLANTGVGAGSYGMVTVDAKGRVIAGRQMAAADVPALDWGKITGRPSTMEGYGITDTAWRDPEKRVWGAAFRANKGDPADLGGDTATAGFAFDEDGDTGLFAAQSSRPGSGSSKLMLKIDNIEALAVSASGEIYSKKYGWLHEKFAAASVVSDQAGQVANKADKATTLAGYGITDALPLQADITAPVDLDTIIASGSYPNPANVNAANGKNWPCPQAGNLTVRQAGEFVYQVYQAFADGGFWHRCRYQGRWNPWRRLADAAAIQDGIAAATPPGQIAYFARDTPPPGWLICAGAQDVARTAYAALFAAIGDRFGAGDGRTTFGVPDLRGEFVRGWDAGRNVDASRVFGSGQASQNLWHDHAIPTPGSTTGGDTVRTDNGGTGLDAGARHTSNEFLTEFGTGRQLRYATYGSGGSESRPRNIALLACIKI